MMHGCMHYLLYYRRCIDSVFYYNVFGTVRRRRQIFMGDTGSMTLGYSIAFLAISFAMNNRYIKPFLRELLLLPFLHLSFPFWM